MNIVLLGPPGCGKGTQARRIEDRFGLVQLSTGDMLRAAVEQDGELGRKVKKTINAGKLVPDDVMIKMIAERTAQPDCANGFVLDGFPRTVAQAEALDRMLDDRGRKVDGVIQFTVDDGTLVDRIAGRFTCAKCGASYNEQTQRPKRPGVCDKCGGTKFTRRADDKRETVSARLEAYYAQTEPLLPYYRRQGKLHTIDGMADVDEVTRQIEATIDSLLERV